MVDGDRARLVERGSRDRLAGTVVARTAVVVASHTAREGGAANAQRHDGRAGEDPLLDPAIHALHDGAVQMR